MNIKAVEIVAARKIEVVEDTLPEIKSTEVEIKSLYSGISHGTEMTVYRGSSPGLDMTYDGQTKLFTKSKDGKADMTYPIRYGYTCVGAVSKVGSDVSRLKEGDIVYCEGPHASGHVMDGNSPVLLPKGLDPRAGVFLANLKTTFMGMLDASVLLQESMVIFGQGTLGQFMVQWAKLSGAKPVIAVDLSETRLKYSKEKSGADYTFNPKTTEDVALEIRKLTGNRGADVAIEVSSSDRALNEAIRSVGYNGRVVVLSFYPGSLANVFPGREFHHNRVQLICSQCWGVSAANSNRWTGDRVTDAVLERMPDLNLVPLISHEIGVDDAASAYKMIDEGQDDLMQVILKY